ncbi:hypothetical protein PRK78_003600 [Emydomyces testavorans]|uniref:F-box domain-containing protein n=1 Tax=Emydomyces testavorans TaxID=2070801 RepID=A0AAF0DH48_9EURO|nr:hypothetical protein PRK78_003600 [Emydomyces testavorans]
MDTPNESFSAFTPRRPAKHLFDLPLEILFMIALLLNIVDLGELRCVSKAFGWVDKFLFRSIYIPMSGDLVEKVQRFMERRVHASTIRTLTFQTPIALSGLKNVNTWSILKNTVAVFMSRGDVVNIQTIKMSISSTDLIPILNTFGKCGVTTIKALDLRNFNELRGQYNQHRAKLPKVLAGIEKIHMSMNCDAGLHFLKDPLAAHCKNLRTLHISTDRVQPPRFARLFDLSLLRFVHLRALVLSDMVLNWDSFARAPFSNGTALESLKLQGIFLEPTDRRRYQVDFMPNFWPNLWIYDGWEDVVRKLITTFENTKTQVEIRQPYAAIYHDNGDFVWGRVKGLQSSSGVVKIID